MIRIYISPLLILYIAISVCSDEYFATPLPPTLTWPHTKPGLSPHLHSSGLFWLFLVNNNWSTGKILNWPEVTSGFYLHERTKHLGSGSLPRYLIIPLSSVSQYHWLPAHLSNIVPLAHSPYDSITWLTPCRKGTDERDFLVQVFSLPIAPSRLGGQR